MYITLTAILIKTCSVNIEKLALERFLNSCHNSLYQMTNHVRLIYIICVCFHNRITRTWVHSEYRYMCE